LTETLMLFRLCELCCAGGWTIKAVLAFGAEGTGGCTSAKKVQESQKRYAPAGNISSGAGGSTGEMS
jgi:hypothetical protein